MQYHDYQADVYGLNSASCKYPNFTEILKYHPYSVNTFAGFADVTQELLLEAIRGNEELTAAEVFKCAKYSGLSLNVLICPKLITLDRNNRKHRGMMEQLRDKLHEIGELQKRGSKYADWYMNAKYIDRGLFILTERQFQSGQTVTYGCYLGIREKMCQTLSFAQGEFRTAPRGVKHSRKLKVKS